MRNTLLFGKTLRAFRTKVNIERIDWLRITNSGKVIIERIGQPACLSPKPATDKGMVRRQRLNGCWSLMTGLVILRRLKIQSRPLGKLKGYPG
jgi:hypothetical protein